MEIGQMVQNPSAGVSSIGLNLRCALVSPFSAFDSSTIFLNDDCLVEIFKRISIDELIVLCDFCEHCFNLIKMRILAFRAINIEDLYGRYYVEQMLAYFGSSITNLSIHRRHVKPSKETDSQRLLEMLINSCGAGALKKLDISLNFNDIDSVSIASFAAKLQNVIDLTITGSHYKSKGRKLNSSENSHQIGAFLQKTVHLKSIKVNMMPITGEFLQKPHLKHLIEVSFVQCDGIRSNALIESAGQLTCLQKFTWKNTKFHGIDSISENIETLCSILGRKCQSLTEVSLHMNYNVKYCYWKEKSVLGDLKRLPHLSSLSIGLAGACACNDFFTCIQQLNKLKSLAIESPLIAAGRICLPCTKVISNHLPSIFAKLRNLMSFRIVHINPRVADFLNEIVMNCSHIQELHLIGFHDMNENKLFSLIQNTIELKVLNVQETRFRFTVTLYKRLVDECQRTKRFIRILVGHEMKRTIFAALQDGYRKEFVQIIS